MSLPHAFKRIRLRLARFQNHTFQVVSVQSAA
jgi:hypothetical protein